MKLVQLSLCCLLSISLSSAQVVINEFDSDTPSTDLEEFVELRSENPNTPLDGYVLVFFNGSPSGDDRSYFTVDLAGSTTDINGLLLIGSENVSPNPDLLVPANTFQNGTDAVALYIGKASDFPDLTKATTENLVDAIVYQTGRGDGEDTELQMLLGVNFQVDEDINANKDNESIQRDDFANATYTVKAPTPGALNDGSGVIFNRVSFTTDKEIYEEGETLNITFTTTEPVMVDLAVNFSLHNDSFTANDFVGPSSFTISAGESSVLVAIQLLVDGVNDGDEFANIDIGDVPETFRVERDNILIQVNDLDAVVAEYGTPLNPTYDQVQATTPAGYYDRLDGKADNVLRQAMQDIIANPTVVRTQTYSDIVTILKTADQNPANSNEVWLLYSEQGRKKILFQDQGGSNVGLWNREHTYPQSRGDFSELEDFDEFADGLEVFRQTNADSLRHAFSDGHGLRAADGPENSSRGNQDYGEYSGPNGVAGSWRGDVARAVMFLAVRYNALTLVEGNPADDRGNPLGDLTVLLEWHRQDPPDDFELNRNNVVFDWQKNRNPFIDNPILVEHIFGNMQGVPYDASLSVQDNFAAKISVYPNPTNGSFGIVGLEQITELSLYNLLGQKVFTKNISPSETVIANLPSGLYFAVLNIETASVVTRLVIE